jgi:hypothetical protein
MSSFRGEKLSGSEGRIRTTTKADAEGYIRIYTVEK